MGVVADEMVRLALQEWETFGRSVRSLADEWTIVGNESQEPYTSHITRYWATVGHPHWDGATPEPWSGAFVSWCFVAAEAGDAFRPHGKHSQYVDWIRLQDGTSPLLRLRRPSRSVASGDLIWNARGAGAPAGYDEAVARLEEGDFFISHVDVVVDVRAGECDSVGGNVYPGPVGGSVVKSTWRLDANGTLADERKTWLGVVKNGL
jgi:hypothetical protein